MSPPPQSGPGSRQVGARREVQALRALDLQIAVLAALLMLQLWGLVAALEAWAAGERGAVIRLLALQGAGLATALATVTLGHRRPPER